MVKPFKLSWPIGRSDAMDKEDIENTKQALDALGLYEPPQLFTERFSTEPMIRGLKTFQRQEGLLPDGVMNPGGPTHDALNRALATGFQDGPENSDHASSHTTAFGSNSSFQTGLPYLSNSPSQQNRKEAPNNGGVHQSDTQVAAGPALPFGVWLMQTLGTATIALAMAIYNSWSKNRQKIARDTYESATSEHDPKRYDRCHERWLLEQARCGLRAPLWRHGCKERATKRQNLCYDNGGDPNPDEPDEWSDKDEEVSPRAADK